LKTINIVAIKQILSSGDIRVRMTNGRNEIELKLNNISNVIFVGGGGVVVKCVRLGVGAGWIVIIRSVCINRESNEM